MLLLSCERCTGRSSSLHQPLDILDERGTAAADGVCAVRLLDLSAGDIGSGESAVDESGAVASGKYRRWVLVT